MQVTVGTLKVSMWCDWQVSLLEAKAAAAACHKQCMLLLQPPSEALPTPLDPATGIRKPSNDIAHLQQLIAEVIVTLLHG